jgi:hypothetical protein
MDYPRPQHPTAPEEQQPNPPMVYISEAYQWQYKRLSRNLKNGAPPTEDELNEYGKDGWELVSSIIYADMLHLYFKRPSK